ncbi:MAG: hypothetical protein H6558_18355 [Lewinellaceae bacterium]|nr:hypothetical protein [Lewinellaceae bacterium]
METLVVFTTYYVNREDENHLFHAGQIRPVSTTQLEKLKRENTGAFEEESSLYQLVFNGEEQLVFAHPVLETYGIRRAFIAALFADVLDALKEEEKEKLKHILFILHRKELDSAEKFEMLKGKRLHDNLENIRKVNGMSREIEASSESDFGERVLVDFIAFAHEPGHPIYKILTKFEPTKVREDDVGTYIKAEIERIKKLF